MNREGLRDRARWIRALSAPTPHTFKHFWELLRLSFRRNQAQFGDRTLGGASEGIQPLLDRLSITAGSVVDIGAGDGVHQSATAHLFRSVHWHGLAVEADSTRFSELVFAWQKFPNVNFAKTRVTPNNAAEILRAYSLPDEFTVLSLDIDSYDLFVLEAILAGGFRPQIISMEINECIPPPLFFTVLYENNQHWRGDRFFGCSIVAAHDLAGRYGYAVEGLRWNNLRLVRADLAGAQIVHRSAEEAYASGYVNRPERKRIFRQNSAVDKALEMTAEEALSFFDELFRPYRGKYELRLSP